MRFAAVGGLCLLGGAGIAQDAARTEADLRELRSEIERIRGQVAADAAARDRLTRELRSAEQSSSAARASLRRLRSERESGERRQSELIEQQRQRTLELAREREALAAQLRAAYRIGGEEPLRWLLDQDDPQRAARLYTYHGYLARARAQHVANIESSLQELASIEQTLGEQQQRLATLEREQTGELDRLDQARNERSAVLARLQQESRARAASLQRLQREQAALEKLLRELRRTTQRCPQDNSSPFAQLRGKLSWPAAGRLVARFGQPRAGSVKWDGVLIAAERGTPVRAVHRGRVVYADWLAGLGLLVIVDHGGGYLSLYGHNEQLFRAVGDAINAGDTIGAVGDSGGRPRPELYFEIRQGARPIDPMPWFATRQP